MRLATFKKNNIHIHMSFSTIQLGEEMVLCPNFLQVDAHDMVLPNSHISRMNS